MHICYRDLETIVEMCWDYVEILKIKLSDIDSDKAYKRTLYNLKIKQINKIGNDIAAEIKYNKSCSKVRRIYKTTMIVWMAVTSDKYELPLAVEDSADELAKKLSITRTAVYSREYVIRKREQKGAIYNYKIIKVDI